MSFRRHSLIALLSILFFVVTSGAWSEDSTVEATGGVRTQALASPTIHYTFDEDLTDTTGNSSITAAPNCPADPCNSSASFGSDSNGKYWTWTSTNSSSGGGFTLLTNTAIGEKYTIAMKFSFSQVSGWRKIIDFRDRTTDEGFYYFQGKMQFYSGRTGNEVYPVNTVLDLVIVRDNGGTTDPNFSDDTFTVYGVGANNVLTQLIQYNDTTGESIPFVTGGKTKLGFFFDDLYVTGEATPSGKVYDLRIWRNTVLSTQDLTAAATRPAAVTNVVGSPSTQSVIVTWTGVADATSYVASVLGGSCTVAAPATTCTITGLTDGSSGTVQVQAVGPGGYSTPASTPTAVVVGATTSTIASTTTTVAATTTTVAATTTTVAATTTTVAATTTTVGTSSTTSAVTTTTLSPAGLVTAPAARAAAPDSASGSASAESLPETGLNLSMRLLVWSLILIWIGCVLRHPRRDEIH